MAAHNAERRQKEELLKVQRALVDYENTKGRTIVEHVKSMRSFGDLGDNSALRAIPSSCGMYIVEL